MLTAAANSYKGDLLDGVHQPSDVYMLALYTAAAGLSKETAAYDPTNEVVGLGYIAGGQALTGRTAGLDGDTAVLDFADPVWPNATITARGALIYNATRASKAVVVLDFGEDVTSTNGTFTVALPAPTAADALVRIT
jgi:hypothetical protein